MIIAGAGGHAREVLGVLEELQETSGIYFYDDTSRSIIQHATFSRVKVIRTEEEARKILQRDNQFIIGVGKPELRSLLSQKLTNLGGTAVSLIAPSANIGEGVELAKGLNIMHGAVITKDVQIGFGTLVHIHVSIHHDSRIGKFCELSPGCRLLGNVTIRDMVSIGTNAVVLPGITIGDVAVVGAGAVVTKNVSPGKVVKGIPAE